MKGNEEARRSGRKSSRRACFAVGVFLMVCWLLLLTGCGSSGNGNASDSPERGGEETASERTAVQGNMDGTAAESSAEEMTEEAGDTERSAVQQDTEESEKGGALDAGEGTVAAWAEAFCKRDGGRIAAMCSEKAENSLREQYLLDDVAGDAESKYVFGWSSPWPWYPDLGYEIIEETDSSAVILYYAGVSDPHVSVWRETLQFRQEKDGIAVENETFEMLEAICMGEEYVRAYPHGINGTPMDYLENGLGEILNENAKERRGDEAYARLFDPETAAIDLLNLLNNPSKVQTEMREERSDGRVLVNIIFAEDGSDLVVEMLQPYGADGIWIVQDHLFEKYSK